MCAVNVAKNSTVIIRGEGMDLRVPMTDAVAAILSRLVEVYIELRMCTSIGAISEHILLQRALTSEPGHHASRRWIVEKAMVAMHGAMQDGLSENLQGHCSLPCCWMVLTSSSIASMSMPSCSSSQALGQGECVRCFLVWLMWHMR